MNHRIGFSTQIVLAVTVLLIGPAAAPITLSAQEQAHFGSGIVLLNPPEKEVIFVGALSSSGRYAAGTAISGGGTAPTTGVHLWDLSGIDPEGSAVEPEPTATFDLAGYLGGKTVPLDSGNYFAFAPDQSVLAVLAGDEILLLTVPDLAIKQSIPLPPGEHPIQHYNHLRWSVDGDLLAAAQFEGDLLVWDRAKGQIARQPGPVQDFSRFGSGWLIEYQDRFALCTVRLEHCTVTPIEGSLIAVNPAQGIIVSGDWYGHMPVITWIVDAAGQVTQDAHRFDSLNGAGVPTGFSPSGRYIAVMAWTTGRSPDYPFWTLWDTKRRVPLYEVGEIRPPVWLGRDDYFVSGDGGSLYTPASSTPLDVTEDVFSTPGIAESTPEETAAKLRLYHEVWGVQDVTADGSRFLLIIGGTALVVPVVYPS